MITRPAALLGAALLLAVSAGPLFGQNVYYPDRWEWETRSPDQMGMDGGILQEAIELAIAAESTAPRDLALNHAMSWGREPYDAAVGPHKIRGPQTGVIVKGGYIVAEWGEPERVDMTFSVTKSFLSTTVGLAWDDGLIRDVHDLVQPYMPLGHFDSEHNSKITWNHLRGESRNERRLQRLRRMVGRGPRRCGYRSWSSPSARWKIRRHHRSR